MVRRTLGGEADDAGRARVARFSRRRGTAFFAGRALSAAKPKADSTVAAANQRFQKSAPLGLLFFALDVDYERFANGRHIRGMEFDLNQSPDAESIAGISPGREHN